MANFAFLADSRDPQLAEPTVRSPAQAGPVTAPSPQQDAAAKPDQTFPREIAPVPHISIHAFCDNGDLADVIEAASADRLMSRAHLTLHREGLGKAEELYLGGASPNLLVVESRLPV